MLNVLFMESSSMGYLTKCSCGYYTISKQSSYGIGCFVPVNIAAFWVSLWWLGYVRFEP